jgi:hypothetical protein
VDVLLIDDKEGERLLLEKYQNASKFRILHSNDLTQIRRMASPEAIPDWPSPPYLPVAAVIDLDLGHVGHGAAGGIVAIKMLRAWQRRTNRPLKIVLRTADVSEELSLAAVLAAELSGGALPIWGKDASDAGPMFDYIHQVVRDPDEPSTPDPSDFAGSLVHPVRLVLEERSEQPLGRFLFAGIRAAVWARLRDGLNAELSVIAAGATDHHKFWERQQPVISAILQMRENGPPLHELAGQPIRVRDIERDTAESAVRDIDVAIYSARRADATEAVIELLMAEKARYEGWLDGTGERRPYQNRSSDQGEFWGLYGGVLGHDAVIGAFRRRSKSDL